MTFGLGGGQEGSYPVQLDQFLNEAQEVPRFRVINAGIPGYTSTKVTKELAQNLTKYKPAILFIMVGTNDNCIVEPVGQSGGYQWLKERLGAFRIAKLCRYMVAYLARIKHRMMAAEPVRHRTPTSEENLLLTEVTLGRFDDALKRATHLLEEGQATPTVHSSLGVIYLNTGERERAITHFAKAIELDPQDVQSMRQLSVLYCGMGAYVEGFRWCAESVLAGGGIESAYLFAKRCEAGGPQLTEAWETFQHQIAKETHHTLPQLDQQFSEETFRANVLEVSRLCHQLKVQLVVLTYPYDHPSNRILRELVQQDPAVGLVDVNADFMKMSVPERNALFVLDGHLNRQGYRKVAYACYQWLKREGMARTCVLTSSS